MFGIIENGGFDINADNGPLVNRVCAAMMCVSALGVAFRFIARYIARQHFGWDDWLILMALPLAWSVSIVNFVAVDVGRFGQHIERASTESLMAWLQMLYADQILYLLPLAFIKWSILAFYRRIFHVSSTKIPAYIIASIVLAWLIANILVGIFSCVPIDAYWNKTIPGTCVNTLQYFFGVAIPNIVTDVVLLSFPLPLIWKLCLATHQKVALSAIFLVGGFIIVISSLRLVTILEAQDQTDLTWIYSPLAIWNAVEVNVGVLLACLPSMQPLLQQALSVRSIISRQYGSSRTSGKSWLKRSHQTPGMSSTDSYYSQPHQVEEGRVVDQPGVYTKIGTNPVELRDMQRGGTGVQVHSDTQWQIQDTLKS